VSSCLFFFQAEDGIRAFHVTGVQTCALPICLECRAPELESRGSEACTQSPQEGVRIFVCRVPSLALAAPGLARKARSLASGASFLARKARSPGGISLPPASGAYRLVRRV